MFISVTLDHAQINMLSNSLKPKNFIVAVGGVIISALITLLALFLSTCMAKICTTRTGLFAMLMFDSTSTIIHNRTHESS